MKNTHQNWLLKTLSLAKKRAGFCAPNPAVGAVVVKDGQLIAEGFHYGAGHAHAEVGALNAAGEKAIGADLYVSLEPCCHYGRTPPCTEKIKASGIARVFFAFLDPNPIVAGKGQQILNDAEIICEHIKIPEITEFYQPYTHWTTHKKPFVTAKIAITADGYVAHQDGTPLQITGESCREFTHENRLISDAILSTAQTVIADNPQLNVRLNKEVIKKPLYLLDSNARLPLDSKIFATAESITIFHDQNAPADKVHALTENGVRCVVVPSKNHQLDLNTILKYIGEDGRHSLWVEAGPKCFHAFVNQHLVQKVFVYVSNKYLGETGLVSGVDIDVLKNNLKNIEEISVAGDLILSMSQR